MHLDHVLCGQGDLANGVLEAMRYDEDGDRFALSFSTATSPTQIYTIEGQDRRDDRPPHPRARAGHPGGLCSRRARMPRLPRGTACASRPGSICPPRRWASPAPRPLVYYIHGGPQGQERPNFAWFSMPLIQFLTLNGFAVFVPNVRGSTGYGLRYTKAGGPRLGRQGPARPCPRHDEGAAAGPAARRDPRRGGGPLLRRLHDPDAGDAPPRIVVCRRGYVRPLRADQVHRARAAKPGRPTLHRRGRPGEGPRLPDRTLPAHLH